MASLGHQDKPIETIPHDVEKQDSTHQEYSAEVLDKAPANADYSGATKKTDPAEIKLVNKLDLWIMVCCLSCLVLS